MAFHNPYHFVPVKKDSRTDDLPREAFEKSDSSTHPHVAHDRFVSEHYSGRIICRLTTEEPLVVGASQDPKVKPAKVYPYELDERPAIPASTLRGLISSIAEAASNSSLRVLEGDKFYSYRKPMKADLLLSAIGLVIEVSKGKFRLRPLTLPTIEADRGGAIGLPRDYEGLYTVPNLKVYINQNGNYRTFRKDKPKYYYLKLFARSWDADNQLADDPKQHWKSARIREVVKDRFLLAQNQIGADRPLTQAEVDELSEVEQKQYTRGILRVLDCEGREMPPTKHHEVFIPFPKDAEDETLWPSIEIPDEVVERFHLLADQRTDEVKKEIEEEIKKETARLEESGASPEAIESRMDEIKLRLLPYEPFGTVRNRRPASRKDFTFRLKDGDLVYFRSVCERKPIIVEIALSAIWRDRVEIRQNKQLIGATAHSFFEKVDPELLPFNKERKQITLAEQLFGFVEELEGTSEKAALSLAGRVYPSPARIVGIRADKSQDSGWKDDERGLDAPYLADNEDGYVTLKIMSSPKPPSPAMYFKSARGNPNYIAKSDLKPGAHHPQGRKFYLHRRPGSAGEPWTSRDPGDEKTKAQKVRVSPIKPGAVFYFHMDFDNLSRHELGTLLYALRPTPEYRHKLGLGKPLGLGAVRVDPVGLFLINRVERYSGTGLFRPRYAEIWRDDQAASEWPQSRYGRETQAKGNQLTVSIEDLRMEFRESIKAAGGDEILVALELLGNPAKVRAPVHSPTRAGQDAETKTYEWFVANDVGSGTGQNRLRPAEKCLSPVSAMNGIPTLEELPWNGIE
jgi:CRISPR-associated protein (TIGR03986 family)